jgi:hypothetical protein
LDFTYSGVEYCQLGPACAPFVTGSARHWLRPQLETLWRIQPQLAQCGCCSAPPLLAIGDDAIHSPNSIAEAGATEHQLMALFGWANPQQAAVYTKKANRARLEAAAAPLLEERNGNKSVPLFPAVASGGTIRPEKSG